MSGDYLEDEYCDVEYMSEEDCLYEEWERECKEKEERLQEERGEREERERERQESSFIRFKRIRPVIIFEESKRKREERERERQERYARKERIFGWLYAYGNGYMKNGPGDTTAFLKLKRNKEYLPNRSTSKRARRPPSFLLGKGKTRGLCKYKAEVGNLPKYIKKKQRGYVEEIRKINRQHEKKIADLQAEIQKLELTYTTLKEKYDAHVLNSAPKKEIEDGKESLNFNPWMNENAIDKLVNHISAEAYKPLGITLGFSSAEVFAFEDDNKRNIAGAIKAMLMEWKERQGEKVAIEEFFTCVQDLSNQIDMQQMRDHVIPFASPPA